MNEYIGCECGICGKDFNENDDVVVCPDCGTPMHRACWNETRACPHENRHGEGYSWKKRQAPAEEKPDEESGEVNPENMTLNEMIEKIIAQREKDEGAAEVDCDGVTQKELLYFFGRSNIFTPRYISYCARLAVTGRKTSFNLIASVFSSAYFFYRRMNFPALVLTLAMSMLSLPQLVLYIGYYIPDMQSQIDLFVRGSFYSTVSGAALFIEGVILIGLLLFSDFFYVRWSLKRIRSIRQGFNGEKNDEYYAALEAAGTPRLSGFVMGVILNTCVSAGLAYMLYLAFGNAA